MTRPTQHQRDAVAARGNVLVGAGAGAGKTHTLVQRCLARLLDPAEAVAVDEMLLVTFTEAAAAEMRKRIREALEKRATEERERQAAGGTASPLLERLEEQLALLDMARISTLHGFCLHLVREHFYDLELDPQISVLDEAQSRRLAAEALDRLMPAHHQGTKPEDEAVRQLILIHGRGADQPIHELVLKLHEYTQTLASPTRWVEEQLALFRSPNAARWTDWLVRSSDEWRAGWLDALAEVPAENGNAQQCLTALRALPQPPTRAQVELMLANILAADGNWPNRKKGAFRKPLEKLFEEAAFLASLAGTAGGADPLEEDWNWVRDQMITLLELAREFAAAFANAKRELGAVDFHDLEQLALELFWDAEAGGPTPIAQHWRDKLRLVFVDEYQDINAAQDRIIEALSREGAAANRFLVGDVKQSIYRFRLADPRIFQRYAENWRHSGPHHQVIPLAENFRSHEAILNFVNPVFAALMRKAVGGVGYEEVARLRFGDPEGRTAMTVAADAAGQPRVEMHLRLTSNTDADDANGDTDDLADLSNAEHEARLVALRLKRLREEGFPVWRKERGAHDAVKWSDMVVLLRSPRNKAEVFAKEFKRLGVPLQVERGGFYDATEVMDLLHLLTLLDNPLQDVPTLAVLRSPLVGLTLDELAAIRLALPRGRFWTALCRWQEIESSKVQNPKSNVLGQPSATGGQTVDRSAGLEPALDPRQSESQLQVGAPHLERVALFRQRFARWRRLARQGSLSRCLETVLDDTHYEDWLRAQPHGEQRRANVERLLGMTRQFDQLQRQGLFRFLRFVEAEREAGVDPEPAVVDTGDAVRLMSIHKSKGLEFPVVVIASLGGRFNFADTRGGIILDEEYGLCPQVKPPVTEQRYPSLPYWLAARRQKRELLGEELRLLYVAMTRACDKLILTGTASRKAAEEKWSGEAVDTLGNAQVQAANGCLDWLGPLLPRLTGSPDWVAQTAGQSALLSWQLAETEDAAVPVDDRSAGPTEPLPDATALEVLAVRLAWEYPHREATVEPAKTSVSALRRHWEEETDEEAEPLFQVPGFKFQVREHARKREDKLSAAETGAAHHKLLQFVALERTDNAADLQREAERLVAEQVLTAAEASALDLSAVATFWASEIGRRIRSQAESVRRELPFTARFARGDLRLLASEHAATDDSSNRAGLRRIPSETQSEGCEPSPHPTSGHPLPVGCGEERGESPPHPAFAPCPSEPERRLQAAAGGLGASCSLPPEGGVPQAVHGEGSPSGLVGASSGSVGTPASATALTLADEYVVVQGVADLVVVQPQEIWLVDFKTDRLTATELPDKVRQYEPQLRLYALALGRIYQRPVTERWLYFLQAGQGVRLAGGVEA